MKYAHNENIIEIDNLSFSYGTEEVLKNINLAIHKGDYLGIIGPNGGGKTTLLKIIVGLLKPTKGEVRVFGESLNSFKEWSSIGYIPQKAINFDANFPATVEEVVAMGRYPKKGLFATLNLKDKEVIKDSLDKVGMFSFRKRLIGELSSGQQQRVFIARSLAAEPKLIFLDEPTVGVDLESQKEFYALLDKLNRHLGLTLVLVSHDIEVISNEASEIACIKQSLIFHGSSEEFIKGDYLSNLYGKGVGLILHEH